MKVTVLGCGPSNGVPTVIGDWGRCDPNNPKNRRRRPSIYIELNNDTKILIDSSPDFREQALSANIKRVDAILFTHEHADHIMGIDDLRSISSNMNRQISLHAEIDVLDILLQKFGYLIEGSKDTIDNIYPPIFLPNVIRGPFKISDHTIIPIEQDHGICKTLGFRIDNFAYSTDVVRFPQRSLEQLKGLDVWILDCLRIDVDHPTHAILNVVMEWIDQVRPKRTILTHMNNQTDYEILSKILPRYVEPAYDGLVLTV